jgi:hypothetical protein
MPFLDGIVKPGDGARHAAERELHRRVEAWGRVSRFAYRGPADFILQHGRYYAGRETPAEYEHLRGPLQHCFGNAMLAARDNPELIYTEGVYVILGRVSEHAWVTGPDGLPVELTFPTDPDLLARSKTPLVQEDDGEGGVRVDPHGGFAQPPTTERWAYFGVQFPHVELVEQIVNRSGTTSIINKSESGWPLLRQPWTPLVRALPDNAWTEVSS